MYLFLKHERAYSSHYFLLLLSILMVSMLLYVAIKRTEHITLTPPMPPVIEKSERRVAITLSAPPVQKQQPKPIEKVVPKPVVKKVEKTVEPVVKPKSLPEPTVAEIPIETLVEAQPVAQEPLPVTVPQPPLPPKPLFDAQMKSEFIAGLYAALEANKVYPKMAKRRKLSGTAHIHFTLHKDGTIEDVYLDESCGHRLLDKAALKLVKVLGSYQAIPDAVSLVALDLHIPVAYKHH
ncbi:MAG: TonB family protein [Campylobacterota bacterium]|nr:TonB family protein [Campylobacterota bacterium]